MANITIRRERGTPAARELDPFRLMRDVLGWDPFREMAAAPFDLEPLAFAPAFEVKETKEGYLFKADLPGVKETDIDVNLTGNRLMISGKREEEKQEKTDTWFCYERGYGTFTRTFTLPEGADVEHVHAELKNGVLAIQLPKQPDAQPRKIPVKTTEKKA